MGPISDVLQTLLAGFPIFVLHLLTTLLVWVASITLYAKITPHHELPMIRDGNVATAISFGSAALGLAVPLAFCLAGSINVYDILLWSVPILLLQVSVFFLFDAVVRDVPGRLSRNDMACAIFLALCRLGVAAIIAGAISD